MALFRPYEQGRTEPVDDKGTRRARGRSGASVAPRPEVVEDTTAPTTAPDVTDRAAATDQPAAKGPRQPRKKGTRTPTRAEAEAARMARLHPTLSPKEQKKAEREAAREQRVRQLNAVDASPERQLLRDHIDSRWTLPEFTMPIFAVLLVGLFTIGRNNVQALYWMNIALTAVLVLMAINIALVWRSYKKLALARGLQPQQRGMFMYGMNRMMAFRAIRQPRARIARGEKY